MIRRYSSRTHPLGSHFLQKKLQRSKQYDRIAGYFSSSVLEVAGEAIETMDGVVRIVCNSDLQQHDVITAKAAEQAQRREWMMKSDPDALMIASSRLKKLYTLLTERTLQVRVLPNEYFGLIHGKAGVITLQNDKKVAFIGSMNESLSAWEHNYEMLWEDSSEEAIRWVVSEFEALWNHPKAIPLSESVIKDIGRISARKVLTKNEWDQEHQPAGAIVETPVYRREFGLWPHQKYFVKMAWDTFQEGRPSRYILADQVGLGKTIQLALSALLIALKTEKPILIIAPKTLIWQWQEEMKNLLNMPSAVWDNKKWVDENRIEYPSNGKKSILNCPRRVGIVSQGLIVHSEETVNYLLSSEYECVLVDECHRARRRSFKPGEENEKIRPNNLMRFLLKVSKRTRHMFMATATPVQLHPIEAYDLLSILAEGSEHILGNQFSFWQQNKKLALDLIQGREIPPKNVGDLWDWIRNPLPPSSEDPRFYGLIRRSLDLEESVAVAKGPERSNLSLIDNRNLESNAESYFMSANPFIRHIIRRERSYLENTINPATGEPYMQSVKVVLHGEAENEAIPLPGYLHDAYKSAEDFCKLLGERMKGAGFLRTMLLRRMGSSIIAGRNTALTLLGETKESLIDGDNENEEEDSVEFDSSDDMLDVNQSMQNVSFQDKKEQLDADRKDSESQESKLRAEMTDAERSTLERLIKQLDTHRESDPKYDYLKRYLFEKKWVELGCIVFSQYYDTVYYMADMLSREYPDLEIAIYAGGQRSGILTNGRMRREKKETIKKDVQAGKIKLIFGTDSASEGLNLQRLGTLINLDLPWNPTRLEQRKGRIQRIGQLRDEIDVYNMRYKDSVEDRVHELLSERLEEIFSLFGQLPDVLQDAWIDVAVGKKEDAKKVIDKIPDRHPFEIRYKKIEDIDWESCERVLLEDDKADHLFKKWK